MEFPSAGGYIRTNGEERSASISCGVQRQAEILQTCETECEEPSLADRVYQVFS